MGIGKMIKNAKAMNQMKNLSMDGLFSIYENQLREAKENQKFTEEELAKAIEEGDTEKIAKLEKELKKIISGINLVEKGITGGMAKVTGGMRIKK